MNRNPLALDMLQDPVVGGRRPPRIVLGLQPVDRDDEREPRQAAPLPGNLADRARDDLRVDPAGDHQRKQGVQLLVPDQRLAADDGDVERTMVVDQTHHAVHESLAFEVPNLAQRHLAAEMVLAVGIAAGTVQRAFTGDFNRERRHISGENTAPGCDDPIHC